MVIYNEYQKTGIVAVDAVASCVSHFRKIKKPLKTIYLNPSWYGQFEKWISKQMSEEEFLAARVIGFKFDNVDVVRASVFAINNIYWDFYE